MSTISKPSPPLHYLIPLFPGFQLLDLAGPLDILNLLSSFPGSGLDGLTLTFVASTMDPVPVKPIPPKSKPWTYDVITPGDPANTPVNTTFNQYILPDMTFETYLARLQTEDTTSAGSLQPIDVVFIPGGVGTRLTRIYPPKSPGAEEIRISNVADAVEFVSAIAPHIRHSIMTVCTGSDLLGSTGLLNNRRATTNMTRWNYVTSRHPQVLWQKHRRYVHSSSSEVQTQSSSNAPATIGFAGDIWTSAGISAGIDVMFAFVTETSGRDIAKQAAKALEYNWTEVAEGAIDPMYDTPIWREFEGKEKSS